jgi:uncharacterized RDD family membrane protein YckC
MENAQGSAMEQAGGSKAIDKVGKADLGKRFVAYLIDELLAGVMMSIPYIGGIAGAAYLLVRDGLELDFMDHRSLGKKLMKLRPVRLDGKPVDIATSIRRNWMFALGGALSLLTFIPVLGWVVALILVIPLILASLVIGLIEVIRVFTDPRGRRLGDAMADTVVVEGQE